MNKINNTFRKTCRMCAEDFIDKLVPLFEDENMLTLRFIYKGEYDIKIIKNDGMPQNICVKCLNELSRINSFLTKCKKSEEIFLKKNKIADFKNKSEYEKKVELKSECNSDNDENMEEYYFNLDNEKHSCNKVKTIELLIENLSPEELELKIGNENYDDKLCTRTSFSKKTSDGKQDSKNENNKCAGNQDVLRRNDGAFHQAVTLTQRIRKYNLGKNNIEDQTALKRSDDVCHDDDNLINRKTRSNNRISKTKTKKFECSICEEIFENISHYKQHKKVHSKLKRIERQTFLCDLCGKEFVKQDSLKDHKNTHLGIKPYKCEICEKTYYVKSGLRKHVIKHSKTQTFTCEICRRVFTTKSYYQAHLNRHEKGFLLENNEKSFKCPLCPRSFKLLATLTAHCNHHNKTADRKYHCTECNTTFKRSDHLKEHINGLHLKIFPFKCEICPKSFVTGAIRNAHVRKFHSGMRYKCDLCEKDFALQTSLARHKRRHNGDKRFICEICNMSFMAVYQIEKHMETHKIDETTKNKLISQTYEEITKSIIGAN